MKHEALEYSAIVLLGAFVALTFAFHAYARSGQGQQRKARRLPEARKTLAQDPYLEPRYALVAYTFKESGKCSACDVARPVAERLAKEYPIGFVYCDNPRGAKIARENYVSFFPTFTLVKVDGAAPAREVERFVGAREVERQIRAMFARYGIKPKGKN